MDQTTSDDQESQGPAVTPDSRRRFLKLLGLGGAGLGLGMLASTPASAATTITPEYIQTEQTQAGSVVLETLTADPASLDPGELFYRSDLDELRYSPDGASTKQIGGGSDVDLTTLRRITNDQQVTLARLQFEHSLTELGYDGGSFDIFRDKSKIGVDKVLVDDFEDGNITGWIGDTGQFSAQSTTVISESYTGELIADSSNYTPLVYSPAVTEKKYKEARFQFRCNNDSAASGNGPIFYAQDSSGTLLHQLRHIQNGTVVWYDQGSNTATTIGSWSADTNYNYRIVYDWDAGTATVYQDGTKLDTGLGFDTNASGMEKTRHYHWNNANAAYKSWWDNIGYYEEASTDVSISALDDGDANGRVELKRVGNGTTEKTTVDDATFSVTSRTYSVTAQTECIVSEVYFFSLDSGSATYDLTVKDNSGTVIAQKSINTSSQTSQTISLSASDYSEIMKSGESYNITLDGNGSSFRDSYVSSNPSTIVTSSESRCWSKTNTTASDAILFEEVDPVTSGSFKSYEVDLTAEGNDFVNPPDSLVLSQEVDIPTGASFDVTYTIEDGNGNTVTLQQADVDTEVDTTSFTSTMYTLTASFSGDGSDTPILYNYSVSMQEGS